MKLILFKTLGINEKLYTHALISTSKIFLWYQFHYTNAMIFSYEMYGTAQPLQYHTIDNDPSRKNQLASRNKLEVLMRGKFGHDTLES